MNFPREIARVSILALRSPHFESKPLLCSRFIRQVCERAAGRRLKRLFGLSARATLRAMRKAKMTFVPNKETVYEPGDLLFKWGGAFGHVGVVTLEGMIAHNTTGRGIRFAGNKTLSTFSQFGQIDEVARFKKDGI